MKLVDLNVLLYAAHEDDVRHEPARRWLRKALARDTLVIPWMVMVGFVRLTTHPTLRPSPASVDAALDLLELWSGRPNVRTINPGPHHLERLRALSQHASARGNMINDVHLAAMAQEHRATVVSYDGDFGRFPGITWRTPDQLLQEFQ